MKTREVIRIAQANGWYMTHQAGSHKYFRHPTLPGILCIPQSPGNHDMKKGTFELALKVIKYGRAPGEWR